MRTSKIMRIVPNIMFLSMGECSSLVFHGIKIAQKGTGAMRCYPTMSWDTLNHMRLNVSATRSRVSWETTRSLGSWLASSISILRVASCSSSAFNSKSSLSRSIRSHCGGGVPGQRQRHEETEKSKNFVENVQFLGKPMQRRGKNSDFESLRLSVKMNR